MMYLNPYKSLNIPKGAIKRGKPVIKYGRNPDGANETEQRQGYSWICKKCGFEHISKEQVLIHWAKMHKNSDKVII